MCIRDRVIASAIVRAPELAKRLISDDRQRTAREVGAVLENRYACAGVANATVAEATSLEFHIEVEGQRIAWLERLLQRVDVVTVLRVRDHLGERAIERLSLIHISE